ncbi:MAG TPA: HAMP domain-containing sensor histidine kinase [Gemmatimonadaceae bacterium]|nr:HAMP domain-containing sensor histidine kinase [Gemmatimonadaceae bacterium]
MSRIYADTPAMERRIAALEEQSAEFARTMSELRNRGAMQTQFLANISHDLRTPLTAIITHAEILRDGILGPLEERQLESINGIISGGRQLLEMVGQILTYARGAANQLTLERSLFTVEDVVQQVLQMSEPLLVKKEHQLELQLEPDIPPLHADRDKIAHVLANLLGNAIDFTPPRGNIWIGGRAVDTQNGTFVEVEVGDDGIGIAPEHHDLIFREFAQVDASPSRRHHGTGLGLAIARKFVELHDGHIWVESALGSGSRFYFRLPRR